MIADCRHLLMQVPARSKFILLSNGKKYMATGIKISKGRYWIKPVGHTDGLNKSFPLTRSGHSHVRILDK